MLKTVNVWSLLAALCASLVMPSVNAGQKSEPGSQTLETVLTAALLIGTVEPRVRYCENGKQRASADLMMADVRVLLAPHNRFRLAFEADFQSTRKEQEIVVTLDFMKRGACADWEDKMRRSVEDLRGEIARYELAQPNAGR